MLKTSLWKKIAFPLAIIGLAACGSAPNTLYHWGNYSDTVYEYYEHKGNFDEQERQLRQIIETAQKNNKSIAPGVYGQLGLVLSKQGKMAEAQQAFAQEQTLFPESTHFIQFLQRQTGVK